MRTALSRMSQQTWVRAILMGVGLVATLNGCGGVREIVSTAVSPDGSRTAYVVRVNSGGATAGFEYEVVVANTGSNFDPYKDREWIWRSYRMPPTSVSWASPDLVNVTVLEDPHYAEMIQTREDGGFRATTDILTSEEAVPAVDQEAVGYP